MYTRMWRRLSTNRMRIDALCRLRCCGDSSSSSSSSSSSTCRSSSWKLAFQNRSATTISSRATSRIDRRSQSQRWRCRRRNAFQVASNFGRRDEPVKFVSDRFLTRHLSAGCSGRHHSKSSTAIDSVSAKEEAFQDAIENVPLKNIRNFSIIAHVDHGKSTLADRLLEATGSITTKAGEKNSQVLDTLQVERERGITVKAQTASMLYTASDGERYLLQLIDTPGHVDFQYEVSRALLACQGALLLVDCAQGVQAQTLATNRAANAASLEIVPVLTKLDLPHADPDRCIDQLHALCGVTDDADSMLMTSAKTGDGIEDVLESIVKRIPPPPPSAESAVRDDSGSGELRALMFDSWYDEYRGVIMLVQILRGTLEEGQRIRLLNAEKDLQVTEVGVLTPRPTRLDSRVAQSGRVAYVVSMGLRDPRDARSGDTLCDATTWAKDASSVVALPGFEPAVPMVFASVYPVDDTDFEVLTSSISRLLLSDTSVTVQRESNMALGLGFRCGFLGLLHMDVWTQRLQQEHSCEVIITAPSVPYRAIVRERGSDPPKVVAVESAGDLPVGMNVLGYEQPMVQVTVVAPSDCLGDLLHLLENRDGSQDEMNFLSGSDQVMLKYTMPWREVVMDLMTR